MAARLLLLEDDPAIARTVVYTLERDGLAVTHSLLLRDARQQVQARAFDLLVLDVGLPDGSGLDLLQQVRNTPAPTAGTPGTPGTPSATPVLMLSARGEELDRVLGLELGADDYLTKPFSPRELAARVKALLRRAGAPAAANMASRSFCTGALAGLAVAEAAVRGTVVFTACTDTWMLFLSFCHDSKSGSL